jgi:signal transduction histidine kinase
MWRTQNSEEEIFHFKEAKRIGEAINNKVRMLLANMNLGRAYTNISKLDSALLFEKNAEAISLSSGFLKYLAFIFYQQGVIYLRMGDINTAKRYFYESLRSGREQNNLSAMGRSYHELTKLYFNQKNKDSSLYYAKKSIETLNALGSLSGTELNLGITYEYLHKVYQLRDQFDSSYKYQGLALAIKDSLYNSRIKNLAEFQNLTLGEKLRLQNLEKEKVVYQNKVRIYFLLGGIAVLLLLAIIFYRNNRQKHKAKLKIEKAYDDLKATQQQLVQAEKMASLGELTAGIAHEIQNPLNFVNNFSEVNRELISEMRNEIEAGNLDEVKTIAQDIEDNEEKIIFHGKRADGIVKSMLQHSRTSSGKKEPVDINALADEYLRLAYHGLRARDKSFNAKFATDFDDGIGKINVLPQDIGRVILNLITNAFYSVTEKKKLSVDAYEPTVAVSTRKTGDKIEIRVTDNGTGIPQKSLEKIFQPFYTTKPTGQGTGLGLSLSYDIVTKSHGGDLKVRNKEGEGAEFIITLPY